MNHNAPRGVEVSTAVDANYWKGADNHGQRTMIEVTQQPHRAYRAYDPKGISPAVTAPTGGNLTPKILNTTNPHNKAEERQFHLGDNARALKGPSGNQRSLVMGTLTEALGTRQGSSKEYIKSVEKIHNATGRIRRLTPVECERLQGFPDDWTRWGIIDGEKVEISDTQRYKMMGNAVTTNVVEEIARRLS